MKYITAIVIALIVSFTVYKTFAQSYVSVWSFDNYSDSSFSTSSPQVKVYKFIDNGASCYESITNIVEAVPFPYISKYLPATRNYYQTSISCVK
jgi:hypothetical protein